MNISGNTIFYVGYDVSEFLPRYSDTSEDIFNRLMATVEDWKEEFHDYIRCTKNGDQYMFYIGFEPDFTKLHQDVDGSFGTTRADVYDFIRYLGNEQEIERVREAFKYVFGEEPPVNPYPNIVVEISINPDDSVVPDEDSVE